MKVYAVMCHVWEARRMVKLSTVSAIYDSEARANAVCAELQARALDRNFEYTVFEYEVQE